MNHGQLGQVELEIVKKFKERLVHRQDIHGELETPLTENRYLVKEMLKKVQDALILCQNQLLILDEFDIVVKLKEGGNHD